MPMPTTHVDARASVNTNTADDVVARGAFDTRMRPSWTPVNRVRFRWRLETACAFAGA